MNKKYWECTITIDGNSVKGAFDKELLKEHDENFGIVDLAEMHRKLLVVVANLENKGYNVVATNIKEMVDYGFLDEDITYTIRVAILK